MLGRPTIGRRWTHSEPPRGLPQRALAPLQRRPDAMAIRNIQTIKTLPSHRITDRSQPPVLRQQRAEPARSPGALLGAAQAPADCPTVRHSGRPQLQEPLPQEVGTGRQLGLGPS